MICMNAEIIEDYCIGCGICREIYGDAFFIEKGKSKIIYDGEYDGEKLISAANKCPVSAIKLNK